MTDKDYYVWGRVAPEDASMRLTHQHFLCKQLFGWLLHPGITAYWHSEVPQKPKRVADVACGNGLWATELAASDISNDLEIVAFDINDGLFPRKEDKPANVSFVLWNVFEPPPKEYEESFDVVNLRLLFGAIPKGDPRPVLHNLLKLLKPGGSLQWLEYDFDNPVVNQESILVRMRELFTDSRGKEHSNQWVTKLDEICIREGMEHVEMRSVVPQKAMLKFWRDNWYVSLREIARGANNATVSEFWDKIAEETTALGYYPAQTPIVLVTGRKPVNGRSFWEGRMHELEFQEPHDT